MAALEPKPIDSRHLIDVDAGWRSVEMEGFVREAPRVREQRQHPAESIIEVRRDEFGRRSRPERARFFIDRFRRATQSQEEELPESAEETYKSGRVSPDTQKGAHLDIEA
ncbi:MAG: hypothetical protein Kow0099_17610 [Candidatus Abyssubacteria bacterium]